MRARRRVPGAVDVLCDPRTPHTIDEMTAVEVQERARRLVRFFYWTPALSHIRRELNRLEALGYVSSHEERVGRVKIALKYQVTEQGEAALREWRGE